MSQKETTFFQLKGYPGLENTGHLIAEYIPKCKLYVEPFAGLGRVHTHVKAERYVLNDKSPFAYNFLKSHFTCEITNLDFEEMFKLYDSTSTFFFIDPPWRYNIYKNNQGPICDRRPKEYYKRLFEILPNIQGDWILCCDKDEHELGGICSHSGYQNKIIEVKAFNKTKMFGKYIGVLLTSNKPFTRYQQTELLSN